MRHVLKSLEAFLMSFNRNLEDEKSFLFPVNNSLEPIEKAGLNKLEP